MLGFHERNLFHSKLVVPLLLQLIAVSHCLLLQPALTAWSETMSLSACVVSRCLLSALDYWSVAKR
jgi:hypothetical protein